MKIRPKGDEFFSWGRTDRHNEGKGCFSWGRTDSYLKGKICFSQILRTCLNQSFAHPHAVHGEAETSSNRHCAVLHCASRHSALRCTV